MEGNPDNFSLYPLENAELAFKINSSNINSKDISKLLGVNIDFDFKLQLS